MLKTAVEAYRDVQKATLSGRVLEASVLVKAAHLLKECKERWNDPGRDEKLDKTLRYNQRLWSLF